MAAEETGEWRYETAPDLEEPLIRRLGAAFHNRLKALAGLF